MKDSFSSKMTQLKAFARIDGLILGSMMCGCFLLMVLSFAEPASAIFGQLLIVATLFMAWYRTRSFRNEALEGVISFRRAYAHAFYSLLYGSWLLCCFLFFYFQWFDKGYFVSQYIAVLNSVEGMNTLQSMGIKENEIKELTVLLYELKPIDIAFQFFLSNTFLSAILSLIIAAFVRTPAKTDNS